MPIYNVIRKSDGQQVYRYHADAPVEWDGMEFATHDHIEYVEPVVNPDGSISVPVVQVWTQVEWLRRFDQAERIAIRTAAKVNDVVDDYIRLMDAATEIRSDDPDVIAALTMLEGAGLIGAGRAGEILNG